LRYHAWHTPTWLAEEEGQAYGVESIRPHTLLAWHVKADDPLQMGESSAFGAPGRQLFGGMMGADWFALSLALH
jgi:hypothetical protein